MAKTYNYSLLTHVGSMGTNTRMSNLDLNVVGWFRNEPKFDLRFWDDTNTPDAKSGSITLTLQQLKELKAVLNSVDLDAATKPIDVGYPLTNNMEPAKCNLQEVRQQALAERESTTSIKSTEEVLPWD